MTPKEEHQRSKSEELFTGSKTHTKSLKLFSNLSQISGNFNNFINNIRTTNSQNSEKNLRELSAKEITCLNKGKIISSKENISEEEKGEIKIKIDN